MKLKFDRIPCIGWTGLVKIELWRRESKSQKLEDFRIWLKRNRLYNHLINIILSKCCQDFLFTMYTWNICILNIFVIYCKNFICFEYQKALIRTIHTSFWLQNYLWEFTSWDHKFKRWYCSNSKVRFKVFCYAKINLG